MPAELVILYNDTPRFGFSTALIHDTDTKKFTTVIATDSKTSSLIIQPMEDTLISFGQSRRTTIQDLEFISTDERKSREFAKFVQDGSVFVAPAVFRTQPTLNVNKEGGLIFQTNDIDTGWARPVDAPHFSTSEILLAERIMDGGRKRPKAYLIELPAYSLMSLELGFHQFFYYYSTVWPTKEFFVGNPLYVRTANGRFAVTGGFDPSPNVCFGVKNTKMQDYLSNVRGVI